MLRGTFDPFSTGEGGVGRGGQASREGLFDGFWKPNTGDLTRIFPDEHISAKSFYGRSKRFTSNETTSVRQSHPPDCRVLRLKFGTACFPKTADICSTPARAVSYPNQSNAEPTAQPMTEEAQKEQFSVAYVRAIAAAAGVKADAVDVDDDSVDIRFSVNSIEGSPQPPMVEAQLKCTAKRTPKNGVISFPLDVKNYRELRGKRYIPRVLIVLVVPKDVSKWLTQSDAQLAIKKCAYWLSLTDHPESDNVDSVTVRVPCGQRFSVTSLRELLGARA